MILDRKQKIRENRQGSWCVNEGDNLGEGGRIDREGQENLDV